MSWQGCINTYNSSSYLFLLIKNLDGHTQYTYYSYSMQHYYANRRVIESVFTLLSISKENVVTIITKNLWIFNKLVSSPGGHSFTYFVFLILRIWTTWIFQFDSPTLKKIILCNLFHGHDCFGFFISLKPKFKAFLYKSSTKPLS